VPGDRIGLGVVIPDPPLGDGAPGGRDGSPAPKTDERDLLGASSSSSSSSSKADNARLTLLDGLFVRLLNPESASSSSGSYSSSSKSSPNGLAISHFLPL
jgi:hypothetical protein